ncbi:chemotaxis protein CheD [Paenibacillaceae bacterium]|nr:chemotaxis protein CheD [Paenibacillaceae bacterium]
MNKQNLIRVGMADLKVAQDGAVIRTTGLGSCVGVTLFDAKVRVAGMAHVMLPTSTIARETNFNLAKYADSAIPELVGRMLAEGALLRHLEAKLAGGAQMFNLPGQSDTMRIGPRNVESCKLVLSKYVIPIIGEDTGGNYGRTIELDSMTGKLHIRSVQHGIKEL